jgi:type II secretory pathway predicted ATPase ExeA
MYESFYQLAANPFRLAPDPNFCFTHTGYKRAREYLEYALAQGEGFVMVTGRPGTGKTMLAETFLQEIDVSRVVAKRITASNYSADDLLRSVAYAYGIDAANVDKATLRHQIQHYFLDHEQAGRRVLLIIDEAQALQHSALEELRILADLQTQSRLMLQLFLIGQESLQDLMRTPDMEQFQQRVIANYHLVPLSLIDARAYIEFRLIQSGWNGDPGFTSNAVLSIYQLSRGVPRHINKICNRLMLLGYGKGAHTLDIADVTAISAEMRDELLAPMGSNSTLFTGMDSIAKIPEIRDGRYSLDDLAINAENMDGRFSAISEATRLAAQRRAQFDARHHDDTDSWFEQQATASAPVQSSAPVMKEPAPAPASPAAGIKRQRSSAALGRMLGQFKLREALVVTGATLALTTISIAAIPTIMGERHGQAALSKADDPQSSRNEPVPAYKEGPANVQVVARQETAGTPVSEPVVTVAHDVAAEPGGQEKLQLALAELPALSPAPGAAVADLSSADIDSAERIEAEGSRAMDPVSGAAANPAAEIVELSSTGLDAEDQQDEIPQAGESVSATGARPTDEVEVPGSESETRTARGTIDRQPADTVSQPDIARQPGDIEPAPTLVATAPPEPAVDVVDAQIQELLARGQRSVDAYRLMTPSGDNAYGYYSAVLALDPDNASAHKGIQQIVGLYAALSRKAMSRQQTDRAARYLDRGLSIQPNNRQLLALQSRLEAMPAPSSVVYAPVVERDVPVVEGSVTANERDVQDDMVSRITSFFKKRKAEAERGEVITPAGWDG